MYKTRVVNLSDDEYVPQIFQEYFLGGYWEGVEQRDEHTFHRFSDGKQQLHYCLLDSKKEAEGVLLNFLNYLNKIKVLQHE